MDDFDPIPRVNRRFRGTVVAIIVSLALSFLVGLAGAVYLIIAVLS